MSRQSFLRAMREALGRDVALQGGQPAQADMVAYMQTLQGDPNGALAAYREYAQSFYVHIAQTGAGSDADVVWPGGSCDRWSELGGRPRYQHRRVIDCEGYAYLADRLLTAAGWTLRGYQVAYILPTSTAGWDYHIVAILEYPDMLGRRVVIGSARISESIVTEANRVWPDARDAQYGSRESTAQAAIAEANRQAQAGPEREVAPLRGRRSALPAAMGD